MKKILLLLSISLLAACGSAPKKEKKIPTQFDGIKDSDFIPPEPKLYSSDNDALKDDFDDSSFLSRESMHKAKSEDLKVFDNIERPLEQVLSLCYRKKFAQADKILLRMHRKYKKNPIYWNQVGTCELLKGSKRKALLFYNKSKDQSSQYTPPVNNIGVLYQLEGKSQKALKAYQKASQMSSFSLTPLFNLGQLYAKYGFVDQAQNIFQSLREKSPRDKDVLSALAYLSLLKGDFAKSLSIYESMDKSDYKKPSIGINLALVLEKMGRPKDAKNVWNGITRKGSRSELNYYRSAKKYFQDSK